MKRLVLIAVITLSTPVAVADAERGKKLHDQHCTKCHGTNVYTREDRFVQDMAGLRKQVERCHLSAGAKWFDEDVDDVVEYLNASFYRF
jgi:mono/diheme cytochrome c family protein